MPRLSIEPDRQSTRIWLIPIASTLAGSLLATLPFVGQFPLLPSFGLLIALGWRLLRPEMWGAWVALPLGLADDLISGAPLGSAMACWTIVFLGMDIADHTRVWRDPAVDWQLAAGAILFASAGGWAIALLTAGAGPAWIWVPQAILGILLFPAAARACGLMDRWRLGNAAATGL